MRLFKSFGPMLSLLILGIASCVNAQEAACLYREDLTSLQDGGPENGPAGANVTALQAESDPVSCAQGECLRSKKHKAGHCKCPDTATRMVGGMNLTVMNPCEFILLYKRMVNLNKWTAFEYYFSAGADGDLMPLTKSNLKKAFEDNIEFSTKVDLLFRNDSQLVKFDKWHNTYLINWLYTYVSQGLAAKEVTDPGL